MKARTKRIEIYLSPDSPSDAHLIAIWERLSQEGRGRAQAAFRQALCSLFDQYPTPDQAVPARRQSRRGPAPTWQPSEREIQNAALSPALFNEETIPPAPAPTPAPPRPAPVRIMPPAGREEGSAIPAYPIPISEPGMENVRQPASAPPVAERPAPPVSPRDNTPASVPRPRPSLPQARSSSPISALSPAPSAAPPPAQRAPDSPSRGVSRYRNLMKKSS